MDRCIYSIADLATLDVAGRVIQYSRDRGRTWTFACLTGRDESVVDSQASGMAVIVMHEQGNPIHSTILTQQDFADGLIVMQAVTDDVLGRKWRT